MKFTCTRENLAHTLNLVSGLAGKQVNLPILHNILIEVTDSKISLISTNLEIGIKATLRAKIDSIGGFTVPAKTFIDYVNLLKDEQVEIELKENELAISCGSSSTKIKGMPSDEFPLVPEVEEVHSFTLVADPFKDALSKVVFAAAKNEIRPELAGVSCNFNSERYKGLLLAATDSYRLAEKKASIAQGDDAVACIVPAKTIQEMIRLITTVKSAESESQVRIWVSDNQIAMRFGQCEMTSRLVDGTYPNYAQIIPESFKTVAGFPIDVVRNKIKAASLFATTGVNAVSFDVSAETNTVAVSSTSTQTGEHSSEIDAEVTGEESSILLNFRYVLEGLGHMDGDVSFELNGSESPCLFHEKGKDDYLYIVMPIRQ